ncbi:Transcription factor Pcc1 [Halocaridina rubra]|uniref:L antigen family member 3 n=1 Tax=Halocaridina rubra TaxID=373956 RepID=A0AAN8WU96_HALRR
MSAEDEHLDDSMDSEEGEEGVNELSNGKPPALATLEIPFNSNREAGVACNSLRVDPEPKRSGSSKKLTVKDNILCVEVRSPDVRQLRTAVSSFMDLVHLVSKTIDQFGPPHQQAKKHCS